MLDLINSLLDVTNLESGNVQLKDQPLDLCQVITTSIRSQEQQANDASLSLESELPDGPVILHGDESRIRQIVTNLLSNAVKFSEEKGRVLIRLKALEQGGCRLSILDEGRGMSSENLAKVMERFGQADTSYSRGHEGAGLGLTLAKMLTEIHGGKLSIESEENKGTQIHIDFPPERMSDFDKTNEQTTMKGAVA